jgi:hypothetical protein
VLQTQAIALKFRLLSIQFTSERLSLVGRRGPNYPPTGGLALAPSVLKAVSAWRTSPAHKPRGVCANKCLLTRQQKSGPCPFASLFPRFSEFFFCTRAGMFTRPPHPGTPWTIWRGTIREGKRFCVVSCVVTPRSLPVSHGLAVCRLGIEAGQGTRVKPARIQPRRALRSHSVFFGFTTGTELTRKRSMVRIHSGLPSLFAFRCYSFPHQ